VVAEMELAEEVVGGTVVMVAVMVFQEELVVVMVVVVVAGSVVVGSVVAEMELAEEVVVVAGSAVVGSVDSQDSQRTSLRSVFQRCTTMSLTPCTPSCTWACTKIHYRGSLHTATSPRLQLFRWNILGCSSGSR
jgi:hypothetical protein